MILLIVDKITYFRVIFLNYPLVFRKSQKNVINQVAKLMLDNKQEINPEELKKKGFEVEDIDLLQDHINLFKEE
jgi:hypothetical protein